MSVKNFSHFDEITEVKCGKSGSGLLIEHDGHIIRNCDTVKQIREDIDNGMKFVCPDHFVVSAVFQKYGIKNANGRIYPENVLRPEVDRYIREYVEKRCAIGALDHPQSSTLSGHDVAHIITHLEWQGSTLIGELELHTSPAYRKYGIVCTSGDKVANMILDDYLIGVSSRGIGSVKECAGGLLVVDNDFEILCWDVVLSPSTPGAYIKGKKEDLSQYVENQNKPSANLNEKIAKINAILHS